MARRDRSDVVMPLALVGPPRAPTLQTLERERDAAIEEAAVALVHARRLQKQLAMLENQLVQLQQKCQQQQLRIDALEGERPRVQLLHGDPSLVCSASATDRQLALLEQREWSELTQTLVQQPEHVPNAQEKQPVASYELVAADPMANPPIPQLLDRIKEDIEQMLVSKWDVWETKSHEIHRKSLQAIEELTRTCEMSAAEVESAVSCRFMSNQLPSGNSRTQGSHSTIKFERCVASVETQCVSCLLCDAETQTNWEPILAPTTTTSQAQEPVVAQPLATRPQTECELNDKGTQTNKISVVEVGCDPWRSLVPEARVVSSLPADSVVVASSGHPPQLSACQDLVAPAVNAQAEKETVELVQKHLVLFLRWWHRTQKPQVRQHHASRLL